MRCANCNCEIGNLTQCPYCGHKNRYVYRAQESGQYGTVGQNTPTRIARNPYVQPTPTRSPQNQTGPYPQSAPTRTAAPQARNPARRVPREITNIELLLRLILLMQCVIALLLTVGLVLSSMGV